MKKYMLIAALSAGAFLLGAAAASAQAPQPAPEVPISIYFPEQASPIPPEAESNLVNRMKNALGRNGLGGVDDFNQFYMTCECSVNEKYIVPGPPAKWFHKADLNFYVVDAYSKKVFNAMSLPVQGVGNSETKSYIECFRAFNPTNERFARFAKETSKKIVDYYEAQCDKIISVAQNLAKTYQYDAALARLSQIPEVIPSYHKVMAAASEIYQKYIDDKAAKALAKAKAVWAAGQDAAAASEAGVYLSEILPDSKYYAQAEALSNEMKARVKSDIDYYRKIEARDNAQQYDLAKRETEAWRAVGVAYGNNQKADVYYNAWRCW